MGTTTSKPDVTETPRKTHLVQGTLGQCLCGGINFSPAISPKRSLSPDKFELKSSDNVTRGSLVEANMSQNGEGEGNKEPEKDLDAPAVGSVNSVCAPFCKNTDNSIREIEIEHVNKENDDTPIDGKFQEMHLDDADRRQSLLRKSDSESSLMKMINKTETQKDEGWMKSASAEQTRNKRAGKNSPERRISSPNMFNPRGTRQVNKLKKESVLRNSFERVLKRKVRQSKGKDNLSLKQMANQTDDVLQDTSPYVLIDFSKRNGPQIIQVQKK